MYKQLITIFFLSSFLGACAQLTSPSKNEPLCNELKHQIIFNGATSDPQAYMQDKAQLGNLDKDYRDAGCS